MRDTLQLLMIWTRKLTVDKIVSSHFLTYGTNCSWVFDFKFIIIIGLVKCITLSNSFYSTNWFYFPSVSTMLDNKALRPFFAILSKWNLAKNFNYNNLKKFYYWAVSYYFVILKKYKYFQLQYSRKRLYLRQFPTILLS